MDVVFFQTADGGEISCENGVIALDEGVASAVYVSFFGGNEDDSGDTVDNAREFWGNKIETVAARKIRSRLQALLRSIPLTSGNLLRIEDAAKLDLQWMLDTKLADSVEVSASIPKLNWVKIETKIEIQDETYTPTFLVQTGTVS